MWWLCRPGLEDSPCEGNLATTVVATDGTRTREPFRPAADPAFDCFYVYPTVSTAKTRNAPKTSAPEIVRVARGVQQGGGRGVLGRGALANDGHQWHHA